MSIILIYNIYYYWHVEMVPDFCIFQISNKVFMNYAR